jgi:uncharacterized membrane protein YvbJ
MALAKCKECGKKVSTSAKTCPSCGVPSPTKKEKKAETHLGIKKGSPEGNAIGIIIMIAFWGIVIFAILNTNSCSSGKLF